MDEIADCFPSTDQRTSTSVQMTVVVVIVGAGAIATKIEVAKIMDYAREFT